MLDQRMKLAIVVPVYGNEGSLPELYDRIDQATRGLNLDLTLQFVNDRSPDNSQAVLEKLAARDRRVRVALLSKNHGSFVAIVAGLAQVNEHDACLIMSADLQDPPELIPEMVQKWREGKPVVLCVRRKRGDSPATRFWSGLFNRLYSRWVIPDMPPGGFDFCLIDRRVCRVIIDSSEKSTSLTGLIIWAGFERALLPYDRAERTHGKSMWTFRKKLNHAINSIVSFSAMPLKTFALAGIIVALLCVGYALVTFYNYFAGNIPVTGWTSLTLLILFLGAFQLLALGILGEYFWNNLEQTRKRPLYIIDKLIGHRRADQADATRQTDGAPYFDLQAVSQPVKQSLVESCARVLQSRRIILGEEVARFERELAEFLGCQHAVGVASGTDALTLALWAAGIAVGDRVIIPAISAPATAVAVLRAGAVPVIVDVDPQCLTIDPNQVKQAAQDGAKGLVPVHLYGKPCDMTTLTSLAKERGLIIVEDCAQSFGSTFNGKMCGSFASVSAFSFYPTKNLGGYGDGGAVVTTESELATQLRSMRFYGQNNEGECVRPGLNSRLDELQAALLCDRLRIAQRQNEERQQIAGRYNEKLSAFNPVPQAPGQIPHLYVVRPSNRDSFRAYLAERGVTTGIHYAKPLHRHAFLRQQSIALDCPNAEQACAAVVSLPCYPGMTDYQVERVIQVSRDWLKSKGKRAKEPEVFSYA